MAPSPIRSANASSPQQNKTSSPSWFQAVRRMSAASAAHLRMTDDHRFDDRRQGVGVLVCLLAGFKPALWDHVLPRLARALPDADVCIVTPGLVLEELRSHCRRNSWSYLGTATNDASLAQNLCYRLHPDVAMIVKVDEDMFLLPNTITALLTRFDEVKRNDVINPGFIAPMIPLNGFCHRPLLERLGALEEFEDRFGRARIAHSALAIHDNPAAACWMWKKTAPLSATASKLAEGGVHELHCAVRLNTSMIAFERSFWEAIDHLPVRRGKLIVGLSTQDADEEHLCKQALATSRPGIVTTGAFAGHFAFPVQHDAMMALLSSEPALFAN
jgi:hypothetical protein